LDSGLVVWSREKNITVPSAADRRPASRGAQRRHGIFRRAMLEKRSFEGPRENLNQANKLSRTYTTL